MTISAGLITSGSTSDVSDVGDVFDLDLRIEFDDTVTASGGRSFTVGTCGGDLTTCGTATYVGTCGWTCTGTTRIPCAC